MVESVNSWLRDILDRWVRAQRRRGVRSPNWKEHVPDIVKYMNSHTHKTIKMAPDAVKEEDMGLLRVLLKQKGDVYLSKLESFKPGDKVLVWSAADPRLSPAKRYKLFTKGRKYWLDEPFEIVQQSGYKLIVRDDTKVYENYRISPRDLRKIEYVPNKPAAKATDEEVQNRRAELLKRKGIEAADIQEAYKNRESRTTKKAVEEPKAKEPRKPRKAPVKKERKLLPDEYVVRNVVDWAIHKISKRAKKESASDYIEFRVQYEHTKRLFWEPAKNFYKIIDGVVAWNPVVLAYLEEHEPVKNNEGESIPLLELVEQYEKLIPA